MKTTHNLQQGSDEWKVFRMTKRPASLIAAVMGLSKTITRTDVLNVYATGIEQEINSFVERVIFSEGHRVEPLARQIIEKIIDDDLYPVVYSKGILSASTDGITLDETTGFECKQWNQALADSVVLGIVPDSHMPQVQQCLMCSEADRWYFVVSGGTEEKTVYTIVEPSGDWFDRINDAWEQFEKDLAVYKPIIHAEKPMAEATESLPSVSIRVDGGLSVISNLDLFGLKLREFCANLTKEPQDDQDFANLEHAVKSLKSAEEALENAENMALAQIADVSDMRRTVEYLRQVARSHRLTSEKLVKTQKEVIKLKILSDVKEKAIANIAELQSEINGVRFDISLPDFAGAMKNKRTIASLHEAVDTLLANFKIDANKLARDYREKLSWCKEHAEGYGFLFNDLQGLIIKARDDFELVIRTRISEHKEAESIRLEAELELIRIEEEVKSAEKIRLEQEENQVKIQEKTDSIIREEPKKINTSSHTHQSEVKINPPIKINHPSLPSKELILRAVAEKLFLTVSEAEMAIIKAWDIEALREDSGLLEALQAAGVDNWDGYEMAIENVENSK